MLFQPPVPTAREIDVCQTVESLRRDLRMHLREPRRWSGSLRRVSMARAIRGSNTIEGINAELDDVAAVAAGERPIDADEQTTRALGGYRDAMTYVLQLSGDTDFAYSPQLLKSLHFMMTSYDLASRPGLWRAGSVYVRDERTGDNVYEGPDVERIVDLMEALAHDLNRPGDADPLIRAAMAHLNLVMIHPFRDGNGRMARCLQTLVLARDGVLEPQFCSIEEYLGLNTEAYYDVLARTGGGTWMPERDTRPWIHFVLTAHLRQAKTLLKRVKESDRLWYALEDLAAKHGLPGRMLSALFDAAYGFRVRNGTYRRAEETMSEQQASRDLRALVEAGLLVAHGERRGRSYTSSAELTKVMLAVQLSNPREDDDPFAEDP